MEQNGIDPRFPAVYQAGGEGVPPGAPPETVTVRRPAAPGPVRQDAGPGSLPNAGVAPPANGPERNEVTGGNRAGGGPSAVVPDSVVPDSKAAFDARFLDATPIPAPARRWLIPVVTGLLLIAAGVFCLGAQYWFPASLEMDPSKFHGINPPPWGQFINLPAPALLGTGLGILAGSIFLVSRRSAAWETALRAAFGLLAIAVGAGGWMALFAAQIFPQPLPNFADYNDGVQPQLPLSYLLMPTGTWLLSLALFMVAVLFVVPRRWQHLWPEAGTEAATEAGAGTGRIVPTSRRPSARLGLLFGAVAAAAGLAALFAQFMFPLSSGTITVTTADGGISNQPDWASLAPALATPLMLSGLVVLGWACIQFAMVPAAADGNPAAEPGGTGVGLTDGGPAEDAGGTG
ncbi:hypothetical protein CVV68_08275 [Arthrobacter livingstonensis]|uniref:Uncharacterized protein n=1 Tax=Arthrobacter livingstonensis TaxID=670078 RepID=A0A2V5LAP6_9MICC|nr:hypothetical protein [Arthrobacter livingstonensis]PYI67852.1 hypothetical protein CVV68_08275 [Arthrobacter livingstonensis]